MRSGVKKLIKAFIPPIILWRAQRRVYRGNYQSWQDAVAASEGYDADQILEKVRDALLKVKNGEAVYERDSVLFEEIQYSWPLLAALLWIASNSGNRLHLIDFGGSLGSSYFQNRRFLSHLSEKSWNIVEQPTFVACGKQYFDDGVLAFHDTIYECCVVQACNTILLSSVLPYIERPYELLKKILTFNFKYIIIDRTPFLNNDGNERLTVQVVPPEIYSASYPAWFFNREKFLQVFLEQYDLVAEFNSIDSAPEVPAEFKGFLFKAKL
jgi:putative methyltransferase (TIGR04325 family)